MRYAILFLLYFTLSGCGVMQIHEKENVTPQDKSNFFKYIYNTEAILVIDLEEAIPPNSKFIGSHKVKEGLFDGGYGYMILETVKEAKKQAANVIKIMAVNPVDFSGKLSVESKLYACSLEDLGSNKNIVLNLNEDEKTFLSRLQGVRNGKVESFKVYGYNMVVYDLPKAFDDEHIESIKEDHKIDQKEKGWKEDKLDFEHIAFRSIESPVKGLAHFTNVYILPGDPGRTRTFKMSSSLDEDIDLEMMFINLYLNSKLPSRVYVEAVIDSIYFVNRFIKLGPRCQWRDVNSVQCPRMGQLDWEIFTSQESASKFLKNRIGIMSGKNGIKELTNESIPVIFEGIPTTAEKYKIKVSVPSLLLGGSNVLYAYYVLVEMEGKYVACVMSHYDNDLFVQVGKLPPLISEVMQLR